jgi:uncharacterized protein (DUF983 family)
MSDESAARSKLAAALGGYCPRCRRGKVFRSTWRMNDACPVCGLVFEREHGYFTGAMYLSYGLGIPIIGLLTLLAWLLRRDWPIWALVLAAWVAFLPLVPWVFRMSRVLWIHLDRLLDPEGEDAPRS